MASIMKVFHFEAAHRLEGEQYGKCDRLHGHSYKLMIHVKGPVQKDGMVINFSTLSAAVKTSIIEKFDHRFLNDFIELPTAENILEHFLTILKSYDFGSAKISKLVLWETPTSCAYINA